MLQNLGLVTWFNQHASLDHVQNLCYIFFYEGSIFERIVDQGEYSHQEEDRGLKSQNVKNDMSIAGIIRVAFLTRGKMY